MRIVIGLIAAVLSLSSAAMAQNTAPASTTATYGAWTQRCSTVVDAAGGSEKLCEMVQTMRLRETGKTVLEVAFGRLASDDPIAIVFKVPANVWLRSPVTLTLGVDVTSKADLEASYFRCDAQFCFADGELEAELKDKVLAAETMIITFEDGARNKVGLPTSLDGFADAFAATFPTENN